MGTSALIIVEDLESNVGVYKHFDGYPGVTLPWLESFNSKFAENRGADPEYKFAQLLRSSVRDADEFELDVSEYTGWGVVAINEWDCDYTYILHADGKVTIRD